ncbi:MAG: endonuclease/exonuclease/phosphatase family protein [Pseudomonadota bacterium]
MEFVVMSWNVAGAKFFAAPPAARESWREHLNAALAHAVVLHRPDVVVLQEVIRYGDRDAPQDLITPPSGYHYQPWVVIDSYRNAHPDRWERTRGGAGAWAPETWLAQGCGLLWREDLAHAAIWCADSTSARPGPELQAEAVRLDTGLYTGSRDTEPRLAVVGHFALRKDAEQDLEVFVVNLHLTTFKGEREGLPARDELGRETRSWQLRTLLHGVVSRFNQWRAERGLDRTSRPPVWVLAGDLNALPGSHEVRYLESLNFVDLNPRKGAGTKRSGVTGPATLTLDYIFAGPAYVAFDPYVLAHSIRANPEPLHDLANGVSDHLPLVATLRIDRKVG